jgi:TPR repeat protein
VFGLYGLLEHLDEPRFYDKLLAVPMLNLLVIHLDKIGHSASRRVSALVARLPPVGAWFQGWKLNLMHMSLWILLFGWAYGSGSIGPDHEGGSISYWEGACVEGKRNACKNLSSLYEGQCFSGDFASCGHISELYQTNPELIEGEFGRIYHYATACDAGSVDDCRRYGNEYNSEVGSRLARSCETNKRAKSCYVLGSGYLNGLNGGSMDFALGSKYLALGCDLGSSTSCSVLGIMYRFGVGVEMDLEKAIATLDRACDLSFAASCMTLSEIYGTEAGAVDLERARWYQDKACALGIVEVCRNG